MMSPSLCYYIQVMEADTDSTHAQPDGQNGVYSAAQGIGILLVPLCR